MKLIRRLVTMALVNAAGVIFLIGFGFRNPPVPAVTENGQSDTVTSGLELSSFPSPVASVVPVVSARPTASFPASPRASTIPTPTTSSAVPTPTPAVPSPTPTPTPQSNRCIVQIDGVSYDVTTLRVTHSGGDIFVCGTDMSRTFWSQHNNRILQKMQQYKI